MRKLPRPVIGVQRPSPGRRIFEPRLYGTWKSDRRRTFENHKFSPSTTPEAQRRLMALFGKITVTWTRTTVESNLNGLVDRSRYSVLARNYDSVVVLIEREFVLGEGKETESLRTIEFGDGCYRMMNSFCLYECFRKLRQSPKR